MRLEKLPAAMAKRLAELECPEFTTTPWVKGKPLRERRVARFSWHANALGAELGDAVLGGVKGCLGAALDAELEQDVAHVRLHRLLADNQR